jgi:glycosyl transferase, family 25
VKIKVISLTRSIERRKQFAERHAHIGFEFFDAVDGSGIISDLNSFPDLFEPGLRYNAGAVGCAISHLTLWQEAADTDRIITICEDDAILRHDFEAQAARAIAGLPDDWDIVVWAWNFDSILSLNLMPDVSSTVMLFDQARMRESVGHFQAMRDTPSLLRLDKCFGTPAYSISPGGARKYMRNCFPLRDFQLHFPVLNRMLPNNGIDIAMNRIYSATNSYCALPPLAITKNEHTSSLIHEGR